MKTQYEIMKQQAMDMTETHLISTYILVSNNIIDGEKTKRNVDIWSATQYGIRKKNISHDYKYLYHEVRKALA